ncbi:hypothetical protein EPN52_00450 [bacterium]|nr:MAG: hypothetical protein EPN52_00450 [bacterium]
MKSRLLAVLAIVLLSLSAAPARAARPLLDQHQWDRYFALFARDEYQPWQPVQVRLDTYSGAPVDLSLYAVDPADVLIANGATVKERAIDLSHARAVEHWRFTPPEGYRYTSNQVSVPVNGREGFYVLEARRGDAAQQVWLNVSSVGLLAKSGPEGLLIYAADLRSGQPLSHLRLSFVAGGRFDTHYTDLNGLYHWSGRARPIFVLGAWGKSQPFLSLLPQAPDPRAVLVVRLDRDTARAGEAVRVAGFARVRKGEDLVPAGGEVQVHLVGSAHAAASTRAALDSNGAFAAELTLPYTLPQGDYAVLASAAGASGSAPLHVAPRSEGVTLNVGAPANPSATAAVPVSLTVRRDGSAEAGVTVKVSVVRAPHALPPSFSGNLDDLWGAATVFARTLRTDGNGRAEFTLEPPTDGLPSTYVVRATASNASAEAVVVASAARALEIVPERNRVAAGAPVRLQIRGYQVADGAPTPGREVRVTLSHGLSVQSQTVRLDRAGEATLAFNSPYLGGNLIVAKDEDAVDAVGVVSAPQDLALEPAAASSSDINVHAARDGEALRVDADLSGATGSALVALQTARVLDAQTVAVRAGHAQARLALKGVADNAAIGVCFVKDGTLVWRDAAMPSAGRLDVHVDPLQALAPGASAELRVHVGTSNAATAVVRIADEAASPGSGFGDAVALLSSSAVTTQDSAPRDAVWHAWVTPAGSNVGDLFALQRTRIATRRAAAPSTPVRIYAWSVVRGGGGALSAAVTAPKERGRYALSVLVISADGRVGAAASNVEVR